MCGGTAWSSSERRGRIGLSPRVRGNLPDRNHCPDRAGSIPACAGEPIGWHPSPSGKKVYPRVCGGTGSDERALGLLDGLSPRVRGNLRGTRRPPRGRGSIPACAGEPYPQCTHPVCKRVYPRVCGGTSRDGITAIRARGLSPRVRGNRADSHECSATPGSIPACAGEPIYIIRPVTLFQVYPRVCGGTTTAGLIYAAHRGLSPRVRGNPAPSRLHQRVSGSIPACAGEPQGVPQRSFQ